MTNIRQLQRLFVVMFVAIFFLGSLYANGSVTLSVFGARSEARDEQGNLIYEVDPDQKFKLLVVSSGSATVSARPSVGGVDSFKNVFTGQSSNMVSINGKVTNTMRYEYQLAAQDEGEFILGPAQTAHGASSTCVIKVRQRSSEEVGKEFDQDYKKGVPCQAKLLVDRETYFVGEPIQVTLQIYCWDNEVEIEAIQPHFDGFNAQEEPHTLTSVEIDGKPARVLQKKYLLTCLWAGEKKIKPLSLVYAVPTQIDEYDFPFSGFRGAMLFGPSRSFERTELRTNGLSITIKELPKSARNPDGLGKFSSLILSLDKNVVDLRSPINLTLKVVGRGNFGQVSAPRLRLPKTVRSFPGSTEGDLIKREDGSEEYEKRFTYIIQPLKAGIIKIPSQEFLYFDPEAQEYKTIISQETTVVVEGEQEPEEKNTPSDGLQNQQDKKTPEEPSKNVTSDVDEELYLNETVHQRARTWLSAVSIPWSWWYILATFIFFAGFFYHQLVAWFMWQRRNPKRALSIANKLLDSPMGQSSVKLFSIAIAFVRLRFFSDRIEHVSLEDVDQELERRGLLAARRSEFMNFLTMLAGLAFGSVKTDKSYYQLRDELKKWLAEINRLGE